MTPPLQSFYTYEFPENTHFNPFSLLFPYKTNHFPQQGRAGKALANGFRSL